MSAVEKKRKAPSQDNDSKYRRRHDRNKFRKINPNTKKVNLSYGTSGILFSCTPTQEERAFREASLLIHKHYEDMMEEKNKAGNTEKKNEKEEDNKDKEKKLTATQSLDDELKELREKTKNKTDDTGLFRHVDMGMGGLVFLQLSRPSKEKEEEKGSKEHPSEADLTSIVERALKDAKEKQSPGVRLCFRMIPVHATCRANVEDVATAAANVAKNHFPAIPSSDDKKKATLSYAIIFRRKCNSKASRSNYIPKIADAITAAVDERYTVNLKTPDVVLIVEICKTSCFIGAFQHFYDLGKLNLHEAAQLSVNDKEKAAKEDDKEKAAKEDDKEKAAKEDDKESTEGTKKDKKEVNSSVNGKENKKTDDQKGNESKSKQNDGQGDPKDDEQNGKLDESKGGKPSKKSKAKHNDVPEKPKLSKKAKHEEDDKSQENGDKNKTVDKKRESRRKRAPRKTVA